MDQKQQQHHRHKQLFAQTGARKQNRLETAETSPIGASDEELANGQNAAQRHWSSAMVLYDSREHRSDEGDDSESQPGWSGGGPQLRAGSKSELSSNTKPVVVSDQCSEYQSLDSRMLIRDCRGAPLSGAGPGPKLATNWPPLVKQTQLIIQAAHLDDAAR